MVDKSTFIVAPKYMNVEDDGLSRLLRRAANNVEQAQARALRPHGVTVAEWAVLDELYRAGAVPPSQLAARIGHTRGAVTRLVDRLRAKALVVRAAGGSDARFQTIALTGGGARLVPVLGAVVDACDAAAFQSLSAKARDQLTAGLRAFVQQA